MRLAYRAASAALFVLVPGPLLAQQEASVATSEPSDASTADDEFEPGDIVVTGARTQLPATALTLTVEIIDREALAQQVAISGSTVDAISALSPSFSPPRQKLSGAGETLRGRYSTGEF